MKKLAILILALVMVLSMAACSSAEETKDPNGLASNPQGNPSGGPAGNPSDPAGSNGPAETKPPHTSHTFDENGQCTECDAKVSVGLKYEYDDWYGYYTVVGIGDCKDTDIVIPETYNGKRVRGIGEDAFKNRYKITSISIPKTVKYIRWSAFDGCRNLTSITLGSITYIPDDAFSGHENLKKVVIPGTVEEIGNMYWNSIMTGAFENCTSLETVIIEDGVEEIGALTFAGCTSLKEIVIPRSVTDMGRQVFAGCTSLERIDIPDSITVLGGDKEWFLDCTGLKSVTIPDSIISISGGVFKGCTGLTEITIPDGVTEIGEYAFSGCTGLTSITIPESVTEIGSGAFEDCSRLTEIHIPDSVMAGMYSGVFSGCTGLIEIEDGVSYVNNWVVDCDESVSEVTLREGTVGIGYSAFSECSQLNSITLPNSLAHIGPFAFASSGLTSITIPESVTSITTSSFSLWGRLTTITILGSATSIPRDIFSGCESLESVHYGGTKEQWNEFEVWYGWYHNYTVYCTDGEIKIGD